MIEADLVLNHIAELATPMGNGPLIGADLDRLTVIEDAAVACRDGVFVWVGPRAELNQAVTLTEGGHEIDAAAGTVLPGFVDPHTHLPFIGWRESEFDERLRGASYSDIAARGGGILSTVSRTRAVSTEELTETVEHRLDGMLALGTTTVEAKSGYGLSHDDELKQLDALQIAARHHPVNLVATFLGAHTMPPEFKEDREAYISLLIDRLLPEIVERGLAEYADAFVDQHAFSIDEARRILSAARERGLGVRLHADQLADDGAAALAAELGASSADHLEYVSDAGIEAMAKAGTGGILLPAATFFLMMDAPPPGRRLIDGGVPVALATDFNPGSCPTESMTTAMGFACLNGKLTVDEAISAATLNAAHTLGRADVTGSIEVGKRADMVVHGIPNRYHLVYRFGAPRIQQVFAAGQLVYES